MRRRERVGIKMVVLAALMLGCLVGCRGNEGDEYEVPEGELHIFADRTTIVADGVEEVRFTLMFGAEDVSADENVQLIYGVNDKLSSADEVWCPFGVTTFSTTDAGKYRFRARYGSVESVQSVEVVATEEPETGAERHYRQIFAGFQFTSVWCSGCPALKQAIEAVQKRGLLLVPMAFHRNMGPQMVDPMTFVMEKTNDYMIACGSDGTSLPYFCVNMVKDKTLGGVHDVQQGSEVEAIMDFVGKEWPVQCGVAMESQYVEASATAEVTLRLCSNVSARYNYQLVLLEDGVNYGGEEYDNVVRGLATSAKYGVKVADGEVCRKCQEVSWKVSVACDRSWKAERMRVVALVIDPVERIVVQCGVCDLAGGRADYALENE